MDSEQINKRVRFAVVVLSVLLALSIAALGVVLIYDRVAKTQPVYVVAPDNVIDPETKEPAPSQKLPENPTQRTPETARETSIPVAQKTAPAGGGAVTPDKPKAASIALYSGKSEDNQPFRAENMLPGDRTVKRYCVRVSHEADVTLRFRADIRPGGEVLAEVLRLQVITEGTGRVLYDGLLRDMPAVIAQKLSAASRRDTDVSYALTVYLDTSAGNRYMNQTLTADFHWWVEDNGSLVPPKTGDNASPVLWICTAAVALLAIVLLILLLKRRQQHDE